MMHRERRGIRWRFLLMTLFLAGAVSGPASGEPGTAEAAFAAGREAAERGDDHAALAWFRAAAQREGGHPRADYNAGVLLFRAGELDPAAAAFHRASASPELAALAHYNLGLIARDRTDWIEARMRFRRAGWLARTDGLRQLADAAQASLPTPRKHLLLLETALGYDSAAGLREDDIRGDDRPGDFFGSLWVHGDRWVTGDAAGGWRVFGSLYLAGYLEEDGSNLLLADGGGARRLAIGDWTTEGGLALQHARVGGETLETGVEGSLEGSRLAVPHGPSSGLRLSVRYRLAFFDGGSEHACRDGARQELRFRGGGALGAGRWSVDYTLEINERVDSWTEDRFASASPVRHRIGAAYRQAVTEALHMRWSASWRTSRFRGKDTLDDGSARQRRDDRLLLASTWIHHAPDRRWSPFARLDWTSNASNIGAYDFRRFRGAVGTEWFW